MCGGVLCCGVCDMCVTCLYCVLCLCLLCLCLLCLCVLFVPVFRVCACVVAVVVPVVYKSVSLYRVCFFPQGPSLFHNSVVARVQCTRRVLSFACPTGFYTVYK